MISSPQHVASFYADRIPSRPARHDLQGRIHVQTCVIGGGLAGLTAARELARRGRRVVLLEAERVGWGASGRNGGFVSPGYAEGIDAIEKRLGSADAKVLYALSIRGVDYVRETLAATNAQHLIGGTGWLKLIRHDNADALRRRRDKLARAYGVELEFWDRDQIRSHLSTDTYYYGLQDARPFHINPLAYAEVLAQKAEMEGLTIFEGTMAERLRPVGAGWRIDTPRGSVHAETVVLATSAYGAAARLFAPVDRAVLPVATYVVTTEPLGDRLADAIRYRGCIGDTRRAGDYYRIVDGDRLLWGGRITTRRSEPRRLAEMLKSDILKIYPQLGDFRVDYAWSGLMGYAIHKMPIVGEVQRGLWVATALGGHGLNTTATVGELVARAIAEGDDTWRCFAPYKVRWGGGPLGRVATQLAYYRLRALDTVDEWRSRLQSRSA